MIQRRSLSICLLVALQLLHGSVAAQQVESLAGSTETPEFNEPIDLGQTGAAAATPAAGANAGRAPAGGRMVAGVSVPAPLANTAVGSARRAAAEASLRRVGPAPLTSGPAERAVFAREPVRVNLTVGQERLVTLPADALLRMPSDMDSVARIETIAGTIYVTALVPFTAIRIIAELVDSGQQIPMDLIAVAAPDAKDSKGKVVSTQSAKGELQVSVIEPATVPNPIGGAALSGGQSQQQESVAADMVQLTRHAARQLYAPRRLAGGMPGVSQVGVGTEPVPTLFRGSAVDAAPVGQWKSGNLYVTAVRVTNRSSFALELPLESLRGRWLSATAQHGRIGAAGTDTDTTAVYLVCDRTFESCL